jgi:hypothetical protein
MSKVRTKYEIYYSKDGMFTDGKNTLFSDGYLISFLYQNLSCGIKVEYFDPKDVTTNLQENHEISLSYGCTNPNSHKAFYSVLD